MDPELEVIQLRERVAELERSEARYREIFESAPISLWEEDWSAVKEYIDRLVASGIRDLDAHLRRQASARLSTWVLASLQLDHTAEGARSQSRPAAVSVTTPSPRSINAAVALPAISIAVAAAASRFRTDRIVISWMVRSGVHCCHGPLRKR